MKHFHILAATSALLLTTNFACAQNAQLQNAQSQSVQPQSVQPQSVQSQSDISTFLPTLSLANSVALQPFSLHVAASRQSATKDSATEKAAKFASGKGTLLFLAGSLAMPFLSGDDHATNHSLRTADAILTSTILTEGLKRVFRQKRPDSEERTSFPSGHATAAFAAATMASHFRPRQAPFWYLGATLIAASRVKLRRHYVRDVVAGAAIGYGVARLELSQPRGLLLSPFIKRDQGGRGNRVGFSIGGNF